MVMRKIKYGGAMVGVQEVKALAKSIGKSVKTGNWQAGEEASKMEQEASKFLGVKYGILANSGSSAGLLALSALELPKGSEVIISACTFPTIFNIILQCGLVPVVVDAMLYTYNFDVEEVTQAITPKTRAIIAVHAVGNPCDMPALMEMVNLANKPRGKDKIYVIEDNCDGWGSTINGKYVGSFGDISITSFHAAHIVSMGVGGGIFTNNENLAKNVRIYRDWGRQADTTKKNEYYNLPLDYDPRFIYEKIGYNFQILELQAAMGRVQLRKSNKIKKLRQKNFKYLHKYLSKLPLLMPYTVDGADVCWFAFPITTRFTHTRNELVDYLESKGIETRSMFAGNITKHPAYRESDYRTSNDLSESDLILNNSFWISVHPRNTREDNNYIIKTFNDFFTKCYPHLLNQ